MKPKKTGNEFIVSILAVVLLASALMFGLNVLTGYSVANNDEYSLKFGENVIIEGKNLRLEDVGSNKAVLVSVDGDTTEVSDDCTETANGFGIQTLETKYYGSNKEKRLAKLRVVSLTEGKSYLVGAGCSITVNSKNSVQMGKFVKKGNNNAITLEDVSRNGDVFLNINGVDIILSLTESKSVDDILITNRRSYFSNKFDKKAALLYVTKN